jgi:cytochrome c
MKVQSIAASAFALFACTVAAAMPGYFPHRWQVPHKWSELEQLPRHHAVATTGVPQPYASMHNPLPISRATIARGAQVFTSSCVSCHGASGKGDGAVGRGLSPPPGDLAWLSDMRISQSDGFMYWTIAEGGVPFGTAMPAFKETLPRDDIWAVSAFIQVHLPRKR